MRLFFSDLTATAFSFKRELLMGLMAGAAFALGTFLLRPLARRQAATSEPKRLMYLEREKPLNYLLVALVFGFWSAGSLLLMRFGLSHTRLTPSAAILIMALFTFGACALGLIHKFLARRLARQLIAIRARQSNSRP